ncbi:MAG: UDP-N-acetylmuramate dehydrogenase [Clostridiales bacterium]|nr:UDP-N-acetylmuramate dehydrogenase [Clostridiales bacterium]
MLNKIRALFPGLEIRENEPLKNHTSFRIGGPADVMLLPKSAEELTALYRALLEMDIHPFVMGNGSNLLFADEGCRGVVIKTTGLNGVSLAGDGIVRAESGALLSQAAVFARKNALTGMEFAHGIPGSVGGAIIMNAGAYGGEMKDITRRTVYLDTAGELREVSGGEHEFSYRHSRFQPGEIVLYSEFSLQPGVEAEIQEKMNQLAAKRKASQPLNLPSAGSAFKRPVGGYAAALIDQAGLKGLTVGGAQVSVKHAGFLVNVGGATCSDVLALIDKVKEAVFAASGIELEPEIRIVR